MTSILDSGVDEKKLTDLKKGQPNVIMFVGLQARLLGRCTADWPAASRFFPWQPLRSRHKSCLVVATSACRPPALLSHDAGTCAALQHAALFQAVTLLTEAYRMTPHVAVHERRCACSARCMSVTLNLNLSRRIGVRAGRG